MQSIRKSPAEKGGHLPCTIEAASRSPEVTSDGQTGAPCDIIFQPKRVSAFCGEEP